MSPISIANDIAMLTADAFFGSNLPLNFMSEDARDESNNGNLPSLIQTAMGQESSLNSRKITQHDLSSQLNPFESDQAQRLSDGPSQESYDIEDIFNGVLFDEIAPQDVQPLTVQEKKRTDSSLGETSSTYDTNKAEESNTDSSTKEFASFKRKKRIKRNSPASNTKKSKIDVSNMVINTDTNQICDWQFLGESDFVNHSKSQTKLKLHICKICYKAFGGSSSLNDHMRTHTGEKPYVCEIENCNKAFAQQSTLNNHMRTHTGEKPYVCEICNKAFAQSNGLRQHMRAYREEHHICEICGTVFGRRSTHAHTHTECEFCDKAFT